MLQLAHRFFLTWSLGFMQTQDSFTTTACKVFHSNLIIMRSRRVKGFVSRFNVSGILFYVPDWLGASGRYKYNGQDRHGRGMADWHSAKWQSAEWQSGDSLARRVSPVRAIPTFPSLMLFSSAFTCIWIPHLQHAYTAIIRFGILPHSVVGWEPSLWAGKST